MDKLTRIKDFILKWSDILIFLPVVTIAFVFHEVWIRAFDPTASTISLEFLGIANFNLFKASVILSLTYFIYNVFFGDYFAKGWEKRFDNHHPAWPALISLALFTIVLVFVSLIFLNGLSLT